MKAIADYPQIATTTLVLDIAVPSTSPVLAVLVSVGPHNVPTVTGGFLKMEARMTPTCVATQREVPRMDLGVIPLTPTFDGNTAISQDVLQEVNSVCLFL